MVFHDICLVNNYAPLENKAPQDARFQGLDLIYEGITSARS